MQSTVATRRALHYLASKIHPQLPLSPREQQQLLTLLTTSFRAHLNREHPLSQPDKEPRSRTALVQHVPQSNTSQTAATKHIDSILSNPLFSAPPRQPSGSAHAEVQHVLEDPMGWFTGQVAIGAADVQKASACLTLLSQQRQSKDQHKARTMEANAGTRIAQWLWSSGLEASRSFIGQPHRILPQLVPLLVAEGEENPIWRWFQQDNDILVQKSGLALEQVRAFKAQLLKTVVQVKLKDSQSLDDALATFVRAQNFMDESTGGRVLRQAGTSILVRVLSNTDHLVSTELYQAFLEKVESWTGSFDKILKPLLWLRHPSKPSAQPGLSYIRHGDIFGRDQSRQVGKKRQELLVELCLGIARHSIAEHKFQDAQTALEFARGHFPDLVSASPATKTDEQAWFNIYTKSPRRISKGQKEKNLQLLDSLLPG